MTAGVEAPPQNIEAEESVLGAMLVAQPTISRVRVDVGLVAQHFYLDRHQLIYRAICAVADRTGTADELMVAEELTRWQKIDQAGGKHYISELAAKVPAAGNARHYAEIVLEAANFRTKLTGGQMIVRGVHERDPDLIREGVEMAVTDYAIDAVPTSGEEVLDEVFDYFDTQEEGDVFRLPWQELNPSVQGGFRRKQLTVLAGWTNMGKSLALDQMLDAFRKQGYRTAIFATEMERKERAMRWLTAETGIASEKMLRNQLTPDEHRRLAKARAAVDGKLPFDYYECQGWSADRIAERVLSSGVDIAAIDPITEVPGFEKAEVAASIVGRFAQVAARGDCHVIAVCHLNRARLKNPNGVKPKPLCLDLKGSGSLETLAHAVLFLHRDQDDQANVLPSGELYYDKVRNGPKASVRVRQSARRLRFFPVDDTPPQQQIDVGTTAPAHDREVFA